MYATTTETAERLNVTARRVRAMIASGRLHAERIGRDWLVPHTALDAFTPRCGGRPRKHSVSVDEWSAIMAECTSIELERDELELEAAEIEAERELRCTPRTMLGDVRNDAELRAYIRNTGGIRRGEYAGDLYGRELRGAYGYLDRTDGAWAMDELAATIAAEWPQFRISNADELWQWLQRTRKVKA